MERERERGRKNNALFLFFSSCSSDRLSTLKHFRCTLPFLSFPFFLLSFLDLEVAHRTHIYVHAQRHACTHRHTRDEIAGAKKREGEEEGRMRRKKRDDRHRDVARGVSPPTDALSPRLSSSFAPCCASTRTGRAGTRRLVASSARAHASRRARTSPLDCSPVSRPTTHPPRFPFHPPLCPPPRAADTADSPGNLRRSSA